MAARYKAVGNKLYRDTSNGRYLHAISRGKTQLEKLVFVEDTELADGYYRRRRGELIRIPDEWVGSVPHKQTQRKRQPVSRRTRKNK